MQRLRYYYNKGLSRVLPVVLAMLGFSSCLKDDTPDDIICMYGTPTAGFTIKGKVTDTQGKALPSIRVVVPTMTLYQAQRPGFIPSYPLYVESVRDTLYTSPEGGFVWRGGTSPVDTIRVKLQFTDTSTVEGIQHFVSDSLQVTFTSSDLTGGDGKWNKGSAIKEVAIKLKGKDE